MFTHTVLSEKQRGETLGAHHGQSPPIWQCGYANPLCKRARLSCPFLPGFRACTYLRFRHGNLRCVLFCVPTEHECARRQKKKIACTDRFLQHTQANVLWAWLVSKESPRNRRMLVFPLSSYAPRCTPVPTRGEKPTLRGSIHTSWGSHAPLRGPVIPVNSLHPFRFLSKKKILVKLREKIIFYLVFSLISLFSFYFSQKRSRCLQRRFDFLPQPPIHWRTHRLLPVYTQHSSPPPR